MNRDFIAKHWYASVYEQFENQTDDVEFLLGVLRRELADTQQSILEVACGGGRISVPLAQAGYAVTGFDADEHMLLRCYRRMAGLPNLRIYQADAAETTWGSDYDVVVMAGNLLINIESELDYAQSQALLIQNAANALKPGGHLYLDFDLYAEPTPVFHSLREGRYFCGKDELGTVGETVSYGSVYDPVTQICTGVGHWELTTNNGESFVYPERWYKHIPTQAQVSGWLAQAGLAAQRVYHNYTEAPLSAPIDETAYRMTIWAKKA